MKIVRGEKMNKRQRKKIRRKTLSYRYEMEARARQWYLEAFLKPALEQFLKDHYQEKKHEH